MFNMRLFNTLHKMVSFLLELHYSPLSVQSLDWLFLYYLLRCSYLLVGVILVSY